ncbi:MAG: rhomboid family intramembrane serine protease [Verrucomicrobiales bacterium]|jgi:membrane associated rhomboid family serine protease|nr:rhomboid family intramembrane serine protease [Verrucomicrobiales bacterium]
MATRIIIGINILITLASLLTPAVHQWLPLRVSALSAGAWWEFFTAMWVHAPFYGWGVLHIVCNMATLAVFGKFVERAVGIPRYLALYLGAGLVANLFFLAEALIRARVFADSEMLNVDVMGASGAVCGVLGAFAVFAPRAPLYIMLIPFPIKALTAVWGLIIISVILMLTSTAGLIAHSAHIGGALTGLLYGWWWRREVFSSWPKNDIDAGEDRHYHPE